MRFIVRVLCLTMLCPVLPLSATDTEEAANDTSLFAMNNLLAWCIVPYDSLQRTPAERIAMLKRLGFTQYAWDWRQQHLQDLPEEIRRAREGGVRLRAVWLWIDGTADQPGQLSEANRTVIDAVNQAQLAVEFWVGFHANFFEDLDEPARFAKGKAMLEYLRDRAKGSGSTVALYNHGDWVGEPENQLKLVESIDDRSVGLVYNFHHAHAQLSCFESVLARLRPWLRAVNLNGMRPEGPKILPLGEGTHERAMLRLLLESGYRGPLGVLGHTEGEDVEFVLRRNLEGLRAIAEGR